MYKLLKYFDVKCSKCKTIIVNILIKMKDWKMKENKKEKYFHCETCNESTYFQSELLCSLSVKTFDDLEVPNESSKCENIKFCGWYKKLKSNVSHGTLNIK